MSTSLRSVTSYFSRHRMPVTAEYRPVTKCSSWRSMSASSALAPKRKRSGRSQRSPSSSFISASQSSASLAVRMPPAGLKPDPVAGALAVVADRARHHEPDRQRGVDALLAGGGLDEVGARHHADQAGARDVAQRAQLAGGEDGLDVRVAARLAEGAHLVVQRLASCR